MSEGELTCKVCGVSFGKPGETYHELRLIEDTYGRVSFDGTAQSIDLCDQCATKVRYWMESLGDRRRLQDAPWEFSRCPNCGIGFEGGSPVYCPMCGEKFKEVQ